MRTPFIIRYKSRDWNKAIAAALRRYPEWGKQTVWKHESGWWCVG